MSRHIFFTNQYVTKRQQGIVLFVSLIALVVMSLAAVALIRSVDTNSLISGNLSFRQTAIISSSYGIESMTQDIGAKALAYGESTSTADGYYAICNSTDFDTSGSGDTPCNGKKLTLDAVWQDASKYALAKNLSGVSGGVDAYGNKIKYVVQRMCTQTGKYDRKWCLVEPLDLNNGGLGTANEPLAPPVEKLADAPVYRLTVRIEGPKSTVSYVQAFIS